MSDVVRVLVVDDDNTVLRALRRSLTRAGYEVVTTQDPREALTFLPVIHYDLIITDHEMGAWDSTRFIDELGKLPLVLPPIIIHTGSSGVTHPRAYAVVVKGSDMSESGPLLCTVREALVARH